MSVENKGINRNAEWRSFKLECGKVESRKDEYKKKIKIEEYEKDKKLHIKRLYVEHDCNVAEKKHMREKESEKADLLRAQILKLNIIG
jgi:hypothetical protein